MEQHRSNYLIDQLIGNKLSKAELDEFLAGLHQPDDLQIYSQSLEIYFSKLVTEPDHPSNSGEDVNPLSS